MDRRLLTLILKCKPLQRPPFQWIANDKYVDKPTGDTCRCDTDGKQIKIYQRYRFINELDTVIFSMAVGADRRGAGKVTKEETTWTLISSSPWTVIVGNEHCRVQSFVVSGIHDPDVIPPAPETAYFPLQNSRIPFNNIYKFLRKSFQL